MGLCGNGAGPDEILVTGTIEKTVLTGFLFKPVDYPGCIQIVRHQIVTTNPHTGRVTIRIKRQSAIDKGIMIATGSWKG